MPPKPDPVPKKSPKQLTTTQNEAIVAAYLGGQRVVDIAESLGVTEWTINHRLNMAGITRRPRSLSDSELEQAVEWRRSGLSSNEIAKRLGYARATVVKKLRERGEW